ncbi:MAG: hypothetical protein J6C75_06805 [Oscillospiraceae bacterium]|nr:hypothetical protein [Oscillospiraceae bacterium]
MKRFAGLIIATIMLFATVLTFAGEKEGELLLGYDSLSGALLPKSTLAAGQRYDFPVFVSSGGAVMPLTDELMQKYSFKITNLSSENAVKEFGFTKRNGYYYVTVMAEEEAEPRYSLALVERSSGMDAVSLTVEFSVQESEAPMQEVANPPTNAVL